ncbi:hypothetical protein LDB30_13810 [Acidithiobacillus ferrooxidans]|uniref:hypothetical protein n=1 Tax=Acidithiobacillus ferrooxidans TaxID=920 RepID=UPI001C06B184|nr:hypothetical protein [Acidithiobacillus ferrooxidans]MBU2808863.1 hypothetical protein [Acidithiobacillus ferrooxidans F221]UBU62141.1 hypothetical protein LDB30_13810 [Acidithiobacillus ferrooxidans]
MTILFTGANGFVGHYMQSATPCVPLPAEVDLCDRGALIQDLLDDWEKPPQ